MTNVLEYGACSSSLESPFMASGLKPSSCWRGTVSIARILLTQPSISSINWFLLIWFGWRGTPLVSRTFSGRLDVSLLHPQIGCPLSSPLTWYPSGRLDYLWWLGYSINQDCCPTCMDLCSTCASGCLDILSVAWTTRTACMLDLFKG